MPSAGTLKNSHDQCPRRSAREFGFALQAVGKVSDMFCIKKAWLVGLYLGFCLWAPSAGLAQQPIRIGATTAMTGEASIQGGYLREGYLFCQKDVNEKGGVL